MFNKKKQTPKKKREPPSSLKKKKKTKKRDQLATLCRITRWVADYNGQPTLANTTLKLHLPHVQFRWRKRETERERSAHTTIISCTQNIHLPMRHDSVHRQK